MALNPTHPGHTAKDGSGTRDGTWDEASGVRLAEDEQAAKQQPQPIAIIPPPPSPEEVERRKQEHELRMQELRTREVEAQLELARQREEQTAGEAAAQERLAKEQNEALVATRERQEQQRLQREKQSQRDALQVQLSEYKRKSAAGRSTMIYGGAVGAVIALIGMTRYLTTKKATNPTTNTMGNPALEQLFRETQKKIDRDYRLRHTQSIAIWATGASVGIASVVIGAIVRRHGIGGTRRIQAQLQRVGFSLGRDFVMVHGRF